MASESSKHVGEDLRDSTPSGTLVVSVKPARTGLLSFYTGNMTAANVSQKTAQLAPRPATAPKPSGPIPAQSRIGGVAGSFPRRPSSAPFPASPRTHRVASKQQESTPKKVPKLDVSAILGDEEELIALSARSPDVARIARQRAHGLAERVLSYSCRSVGKVGRDWVSENRLCDRSKEERIRLIRQRNRMQV